MRFKINIFLLICTLVFQTSCSMRGYFGFTPPSTPSSGNVVIESPTITSIWPAAGVLNGGNQITIFGTGFLSGVEVTFGGTACTSVVLSSSTAITCITPSHIAGDVTVTATNSDTQTGSLSNGYTYQAAPTITSVTPSGGALAGGTSVTVTGTGFLSGVTVKFDGTLCTGLVLLLSTSVTCTTPLHSAGAVTVTATNSDTQTGSLSNGYTYQAAPTITSVTPSSGALGGGTSVTIFGTGFLSGVEVTFGGTACTILSVGLPTWLTCTTPSHSAGAVTVTATNSDNQFGSLSNGYTYQAAPTITSVTPSSGALGGGTSVIIVGTGFLSGVEVTFGGTACTILSVGLSTWLTCTTPSHSAGAVTVTATNSDTQTGSLSSGYTYQAAPTVTSIDASSGTTAGGTSVTIFGTGFLIGVGVTIGGSAATVISPGSTSITATTPPGTVGAKDVVVTNSDMQFGTLSGGYTYTSTLFLCGGAGDGCYDDQDAMADGNALTTFDSTAIEYVFANGSSGFKIWRKTGSTEILKASGLYASSNDWQKKLGRPGRLLSGTDFNSSSTTLAGRVCPTHVFYENSFTSTSKCLYYDSGNSAQALNQDNDPGTTQAQDWLWLYDNAGTGNGTDASWYEGNIKTCADKGMRLPTAYETTLSSVSEGSPGDASPYFTGMAGVPSFTGNTWTASADPGDTASVFYYWSDASNTTDNSTNSHYVRCVVPSN